MTIITMATIETTLIRICFKIMSSSSTKKSCCGFIVLYFTMRKRSTPMMARFIISNRYVASLNKEIHFATDSSWAMLPSWRKLQTSAEHIQNKTKRRLIRTISSYRWVSRHCLLSGWSWRYPTVIKVNSDDTIRMKIIHPKLDAVTSLLEKTFPVLFVGS